MLLSEELLFHSTSNYVIYFLLPIQLIIIDIIIFAVLIFFYKFMRYNAFIIGMSLYLVPQIIHNVIRGGRIRFDENYMFLAIGIRGVLPVFIYFKHFINFSLVIFQRMLTKSLSTSSFNYFLYCLRSCNWNPSNVILIHHY